MWWIIAIQIVSWVHIVWLMHGYNRSAWRSVEAYREHADRQHLEVLAAIKASR